MFPVAGPDQSDGCGDGAVPPLGSVLPLSAQPERDGGDRGHAGRPARLRAAAAAPQHQADEGTNPQTWTFPVRAAAVTDVALSGQGRGGSGQAVRPVDPQPGRDGGVRKRSAAPGLPPASVLPQLGGNLRR